MLDELCSGVPSGGAPQIQRAFGLSYAQTELVLAVVPGIVGFIVEPLLFLLADRYPRHWFVRGGLAGMAVASFAAALAPGPVTLAAALAVWFVATGASASIAQATLVDRAPDRRARTIARWGLLSFAGDLAAPLLLGALGGNWRIAFVVVGGLLAVWAILATATPFTATVEQEDSVPLRQALRDALRDRVLLLWLLATALCDLLDEILVVLASLHLRDDLGASIGWQTAVVAALGVGGALGLALLDRLLARTTERRLLVACGLACAACYAAWLASPTPLVAVIGMLPVGMTAAPLYPLAAAQAYARCPGRSGVVLAMSHLFTPLGLALPWLLGMVADRAGMLVALSLLLVQPLGLALFAHRTQTSPGGGGYTNDSA